MLEKDSFDKTLDAKETLGPEPLEQKQSERGISPETLKKINQLISSMDRSSDGRRSMGLLIGRQKPDTDREM